MQLFKQFGKSKLNFFILGIGSIWFGRNWPPDDTSYILPDHKEVMDYLDNIFNKISNENYLIMIDTAPAYGLSEERLGKYFAERKDFLNNAFIATKWGAEYDVITKLSSLHHTKEHLIFSVNRSISRLGKIDLLYIHGTSIEALKNKEIMNEMKIMKSQHIGNIKYIGASISEENTLVKACKDNLIDDLDVIQLPGVLFLKQIDLINELYYKGIAIVINSPIKKGGNREPRNIFKDLLSHNQVTIILTGTRHHLEETLSYMIE
ncbi:aldo/keto reductase [Candidatus Magnetomorum sp. HK-1]|nr:aldo/keto reductase [Candidatus Magnetomorum sp. HK-1]